jgi:tripartite-type tricarboxylate transporter receptor subunit TctC
MIAGRLLLAAVCACSSAATLADDFPAKPVRLVVEPISSTPEEHSRYIAAEIAKWKKVVKQAGLASLP